MSSFFASLSYEIYTALIAMVPVLELRGAIPVGVAMGLSPISAFIAAFIGNCLPVPFILWFSRPVVVWLKKTKLFSPIAQFIEKKMEKNRTKIMRYSAFGLFLFVAIPLPGTGAWSGAIAASLMDMRIKYSLPSIICGVLAAGIIMTSGTSIVQWIVGLF